MTVGEPSRGPDAAAVVACVGAVVTDSGLPDGRLLLIRRGHAPAGGLWSLPGGRVEAGETDAQAVVREVAEETGLAVTAGRWVGSVRREAPDGRVLDIRDYLCTPADPVAAPRAGDDADDARWIAPDDYAAMDAAGELVPGLTAALASWGCLPRNSDPDQPPPEP